jgi:hypothetical protein
MTDRFNTITVALEHDIRDDDAETLISAICQLKGVLSVSGNVSDSSAWCAEQRVRTELRKKLWSVLNEE